MGKPVHASSDIWHHSLEDLLEAIEGGNASASAPDAFAINLQTSSTPIDAARERLPRFDKLQVYQLQQARGGVSQFQLRLGAIESDLEADAILAAVRVDYPGATKEVLTDADRTAIASARTHAPLARSSTADAKAAASAKLPATAAAPVSKAALAPAVESAPWNIDELLPDLANAKRKQAERTPKAATPLHKATASAAATPLRPARPPMAVTASQAIAPRAPNRSPAAKAPGSVTPLPGPTPPAAASNSSGGRASEGPAQDPAANSGTLQALVDRVGTLIDAIETHEQAPQRAVPRRVSGIDSTRTVRALTSVELADAEAERWFVIQLMDSSEPIDPEQVPNLDIFFEYRLYSVSEATAAGSMHALRLGFFSSELAAEAVASYLAAHFPAKTIKRVSVAERDRFAQKLVVAKKDVGEAGKHTVIEVSSPTPVSALEPRDQVDVRVEQQPQRRPGAAAPDADKRAPQESTSFWSQLIRRGARR